MITIKSKTCRLNTKKRVYKVYDLWGNNGSGSSNCIRSGSGVGVFGGGDGVGSLEGGGVGSLGGGGVGSFGGGVGDFFFGFLNFAGLSGILKLKVF